MASLTIQRFKDLINEIPQYKKDLMRHIYTYNEDMKTFLKNILIKIPYLSPSYLSNHLYHTILYSLEHQYLAKGEFLLQV